MNLRFLLFLSVLAGSALAQVTPQRILNADQEPHNWLTYSGGYASQRHSKLAQITPANAKDLELKWVFQARWLDYYQATPLVVDGIMYTTQGNDVLALDATTGKMFWIFRYTPGQGNPCCGRITRGLAIHGDTLFLATLDAHLIAIDARSGRRLWESVVAKFASGYSMTLAPLVVKDKVIVGTAGGERGIRGYIVAYDVKTGAEAWKFYTVPGPGETGSETWAGDSWKRGGGSIWVTGSYDPEENLTYWGVGNPGPDHNGEVRPGDNLYTCSVVALDPDTGKLKWHYQFMPHDEFDWDAVQVAVLAEIPWKGQQRKVMLWANRNGFFYVLDRKTGEFLRATPIAKQNWNAGFDEKGRPIRAADAMPSREGVLIYPGNQGATNWFNPSYSPRTGLFYVNVWENTATVFARGDQEYVEGQNYSARGQVDKAAYVSRTVGAGMRAVQQPNLRMEEENYGTVRAFDPQTGKWKWEYKMTDVTDAGILTTASDVLFTGGREGYFFALDARSGSLLWKIQLGGPIQNGPMTYSVNGKQYVAVSASNSLFVFGLREGR
ncbi:MAG: pyrroloquinoline quinone-dependent dehydrogenase [Candidatus Korobacteraceae bacterium]